jgi:four helix bundle protein
MVVKRFEDLQCWQKARNLNSKIYQATGDGRFARDFALKDQIRKASISILSNIAEGLNGEATRNSCNFSRLQKVHAAKCEPSYT